MSDTSPILSLPFLQPSQAQKHVTHNEALDRLDRLVQTVVADRDRSDPPSPVQAGAHHIVAPGASADWAGQDHALAFFDGTGWQFIAPLPGWLAYDRAAAQTVVFDGTGWGPVAPSLDNIDQVGIGTAADSTNRLAVAAEATLLTHAGAGHQLKLNKAAMGDTASLLFQTGWSGRAEMGTAGTDGFTVKVSADGNAWHVALETDPNTGKVSLPAGAVIDGALTGLAVQQDAQDATPGRLMRADYGYGPATLLGPVSQSGGMPTGAVIEQGQTASGGYVRFADGTQICSHVEPLGDITAAGAGTWDNPYRTDPDYTWTYPAPFAATPNVLGRGRPPADADASVYRRQSIANIGRADATACQKINVTRLGSKTNADDFMVELVAIGRWF